MAITKTVNLAEIRIINASSDSPILLIIEEMTMDDPDDNQLPVTTKNRRSISKQTENAEGEMVATDTSSEEQVVQDIATAIWS